MTTTVRSGRRRWSRGSLWALLMLVAVAASAPFWFPWVPGLVGRGFGVRVGGSERVGWSGVRLREVEAEVGGMRVRAEQVELPQLWPWLGRAVGFGSGVPVVRVADWRWDMVRSDEAPGALSETRWTVVEVLEAMGPALDRLSGVAGPVLLERGRVRAGSLELGLSRVWLAADGSRVAAEWGGWEGEVLLRRRAGVAAEAEGDGLELKAAISPGGVSWEGLARRTAGGWRVEGILGQTTNRLEAAADFVPGVVRPVSGWARASRFRVTLPESLRGWLEADLEGGWTNDLGRLTVRVGGETRVVPGRAAVPVVGGMELSLSSEGIRLESLQASSEVVRVRLSEPIGVDAFEADRIPSARMEVAARLDEVTGGRLAGQVEGTVVSVASEVSDPRLRVTLVGRDLKVAGVALGGWEVEGELAGGRFRLTRGSGRLPGEGWFRAEGEVDIRQGRVSELSWGFEGRLPVGRGWGEVDLPALRAGGTVRGPLGRLQHEGTVRTLAPLAVPGWEPSSVEAVWRGEGLDLESVRLVVGPAHGRARMEVEASGRFESADRALRVGIREWVLSRGSDRVLSLREPVDIRVELPEGADRGSKAGGLGLEMGRVRWAGAAGEWEMWARGRWPSAGEVEVRCERGTADWVTDWRVGMAEALRGIRLETLLGWGRWEGGPVEGELRFDVSVALPGQGRVRVVGRGGVGLEGVRLEGAELQGDGGEPVHFGAWHVPWVVEPAGVGWGRWLAGDLPLRGEVQVPAGAWVWERVAGLTGVRLGTPALGLALGGTATAPEARVSLELGRTPMRWGKAGEGEEGLKGAALDLDSAKLRARLTAGAGWVEELSVELAGQRVRGEGRVPWPERWGSGWGLPEVSAIDWRKAEGRVWVEQAELAPFLAGVAEVMNPAGVLRGEVRLVEGAMNGWVEVEGVSLRPREPVGALRDIALRLAVAGERVQIDRGEARLGDQVVALSGSAVWPVGEGRPTRAEVRVEASNVAVVRSPKALVRADVDVGMVWTNGVGSPQIAGVVEVHDSVVMLDVRDLVGVDLERPERRPPYFGVSHPALADCGLDVRVRGSPFARVLSPAFRGTVSADVRLLGTLRSPRLLGEGVVDRGQVVFPFGQLQMGQARVRFTDANPYEPLLEGRAEGMNFGYNVTLELGGTLGKPVVRLDTVPPMGTREALQMLTAGNLPNREYTYSTGAKVQNVGAYLAGDLLSSITGDPAEESRLSIRSGQRVSTSGRLTYGLEYRLSDRWSVVGEYDRWSQFNAGVRWRVLEK